MISGDVMQTEMSQASRSIATGQISRAKRTREKVKKRQEEGNEERRADMGDRAEEVRNYRETSALLVCCSGSRLYFQQCVTRHALTPAVYFCNMNRLKEPEILSCNMLHFANQNNIVRITCNNRLWSVFRILTRDVYECSPMLSKSDNPMQSHDEVAYLFRDAEISDFVPLELPATAPRFPVVFEAFFQGRALMYNLRALKEAKTAGKWTPVRANWQQNNLQFGKALNSDRVSSCTRRNTKITRRIFQKKRAQDGSRHHRALTSSEVEDVRPVQAGPSLQAFIWEAGRDPLSGSVPANIARRPSYYIEAIRTQLLRVGKAERISISTRVAFEFAEWLKTLQFYGVFLNAMRAAAPLYTMIPIYSTVRLDRRISEPPHEESCWRYSTNKIFKLSLNEEFKLADDKM
ncbi:hypothetical protein EAG_13846 [Camponotus floridanus]|uniref:Uncharacterized protein n=1 Tax=Camponotus floridanus TaxID=104421 RepID=E2AVL5_CAMFO|nr:hypothetical protein EAG_13846 [Camponotus floridanus]